ncbi:hypothetical protein [Chryseolinea sp. H1M3-3]|uniref:hypothetical protein n=1 Tax=Chryseolinea sp. H1M3-3 TaxID=3034144 RepID=UPI0023EA9504|nr:hypothetical protein [Chryseolinea sp. H1M3-3]
METQILKDDIKIFGFPVKTFPKGIGESFDSLVALMPEGTNRSYYGISSMTPEGKMIYIAGVEEMNDGEAEKFGFERYIISKGKYFSVKITDWKVRIELIKESFHSMMEVKGVDHMSPCVEWYKNDREMYCMVKAIS